MLKHVRTVEEARFSPDGQRVATASLDRTVQVWDVGTGQALMPPLRHEDPVSQVAFSPNGNRILTTSWDGRVRLWDARTGCPLSESLQTGARFIHGACFDPTGERIAAAPLTEAARTWHVPAVPVPVPGWFPAWAERIAGIRLSARGYVEIIDQEDPRDLAVPAASDQGRDFYERLAAWFLAAPTERALDPF